MINSGLIPLPARLAAKNVAWILLGHERYSGENDHRVHAFYRYTAAIWRGRPEGIISMTID